jgi:GGDEF domain-containing protein
MMRTMLWLLSIVEMILGFVLEKPWLYAAGAVLLLILLTLVLTNWLRRRRKTAPVFAPPPPPPPSSPEEELRSLGILEIRPRPRTTSVAAEEGGDVAPAAQPALQPLRPSAQVAPATPSSTAPSEEKAERDSVLTPLLESLRAALKAQTVALLVQEDVTLEYRILAISSTASQVRQGGSFRTSVPLLAPTMVERPVTVRDMSPELYEALGYYREMPPKVAALALAPVPYRREGALYFLVADADRAGRFDQLLAHTLLVEFGRLLAVLLEGRRSTTEPSSAQRPRREIIAEEMDRARREGGPLALALVHLNRADAVAAEGPVVLAAAEKALKTALQASAPDQRIERFGELVYGVFYRAPVPEVEAWVARLQSSLAEAGGWLEGGVSIGVAVLQDRHQTPDQFREDATEALREAYESGSCIILE